MLSRLVAAHDTFVGRFYGHTSSTAVVVACCIGSGWSACITEVLLGMLLQILQVFQNCEQL